MNQSLVELDQLALYEVAMSLDNGDLISLLNSHKNSEIFYCHLKR